MQHIPNTAPDAMNERRVTRSQRHCLDALQRLGEQVPALL
jgi:hypothetical protein